MKTTAMGCEKMSNSLLCRFCGIHLLFLVFSLLNGCGTNLSIQDYPEPINVTCGSGMFPNIHNTHMYAQAIENYQSARTNGHTARDGDAFSIDLLNGTRYIINDDSTSFWSPVTFSYLGTFHSPTYHVFWAQFYEGSRILLVNAETGARSWLETLPVPSPSGEYLAESYTNVFYGEVRVNIYKNTSDGPEVVFSFQPIGWFPGPPIWRDNFHVDIPTSIRIPDRSEYAEDTLSIYRNNKDWSLGFPNSILIDPDATIRLLTE